jgi:hypothetical protein
MENLSANLTMLVYQFLAIMGILFMVTGAALLIAPGMSMKWIKLMNVWIDTDRWFQYMDREMKTEAFVYRHHRWFGVLIVGACTWIFWTLTLHHSVDTFYLWSPDSISPVLRDWLVSSTVFLLRLFTGVFILLGLMIFFRPSLLKNLESSVNRWVDAGVAKALETPHREPDEYLVHHPRLLGGFVLCAGLYLMLSAVVALLN